MRHGSAIARHVAIAAWLAVSTAAAPSVAGTVVVPLRLPVTGTRDTQVEAAVLRSLDRLRDSAPRRGTLVLRFDAVEGEDPGGSDFGRAVELARFLADERLAGVKTVAWLPAGAAGHAVLVALACDEIAMPADAVIGPATSASERADEAVRAAYRATAARRRTVPPAVAEAFADPAARVVRASTDAGEQLVREADLPELRRQAAVVDVEEIGPPPLALSGRRGRELGLVRLLAASSGELARGLEVEERDLAADPALDGGWRPAAVSLAGGVTAEVVARLQGRIERAVASGSNLVWLRIDSAGGAPERSMALATWLAALDPATVRTVAYVPREARGDAALVAMACDELVMHPAAVIGGEGAAGIDQRRGESIVAAWRAGVARRRDRAWSLPAALVVPGIVVQRAEDQGSGRVEYLCRAELESREDRGTWRLGPPVGTGPLSLDGRRAEELGLATRLVDDAEGFRRAYGIDGRVVVAEPGWAERLLAALASPSLAWLLLLIGGSGLVIELKTPGLGFGGFVSLVAFIVYFWSQYLHGTAGWLEVMLFLAGAICLAAEIVVLPGLGVFGLGGGLLVIASIVLASQSFVLPANDYQIRQMEWSLAGILGAVAGVAGLGFLLRSWLPSAPLFRDVMLEPPSERPGVDDPADLLGRTGETTTRLAPAGKARIGAEVRDVSSDGPLVEPGTVVRVVDVRGGRLIVHPAGDA